jgi:hypothetical protein
MSTLNEKGEYQEGVETGTPAAFWRRMGFTLDLKNPDVTTDEEWERWREAEKKGPKGYPHPTYEVLGEFGRPDVVKRWLAQVPHWEAPPESFFTPLSFILTYSIRGDETGTIWEVNNCERIGHTREEVIDAFAIMFVNAPSLGIHDMSPRLRERLRNYAEPERPFRWPDGWSVDPDAFKSGMDFSVEELQSGELELLEAWYRRVAGEVPPGVTLLASIRPNLLKAYRNRVENAVRVLPAQQYALMQLHFEAVRGWEAGIREWLMIARGLGVTRPQAASALVFAMMYGGISAMSTAARAAGDVLSAW